MRTKKSRSSPACSGSSVQRPAIAAPLVPHFAPSFSWKRHSTDQLQLPEDVWVFWSSSIYLYSVVSVCAWGVRSGVSCS